MCDIPIKSKVTRNRSLDVLKLIASYMVVFIHFPFYGRIGAVVAALARFAVPVFFMTSGYFSYMNTTDKLQKKIIHIIKIYLCGFVMHFCFYIVVNLYSKGIDGVISYIFSYFEIKTIVLYFVFNYPNSSGHLWFLCALIYVYIIQYFVTKWKIKEKIYFIIAACLLITHLVFGVGFSANGIFVPTCLVRNFLLLGYPFFCLGLLLRKKEYIILKKFSYKNLIVVLLIGMIETIMSYLISGKNELYFGSILIAIALFIMSLKLRDKSYHMIVKKLSEISIIIYLIHNIVGKSLKNMISSDMIFWKFALPILICFFSTIVALLYNMISKKIKRKCRK